MEYSLGLYEKAIPVGFDFPKMFEITREGGFDRLEISIDETGVFCECFLIFGSF